VDSGWVFTGEMTQPAVLKHLKEDRGGRGMKGWREAGKEKKREVERNRGREEGRESTDTPNFRDVAVNLSYHDLHTYFASSVHQR